MMQTLHYTETARRLFISQPALSYSIKTLEDELGVPLFKRQGKDIVCTEYAKAYLPYAEVALHSLDEGLMKLRQMQIPETTVSIGYIHSLSYHFLPSVIQAFQDDFGAEKINFSFCQDSTNELLGKLASGELDVAFGPECKEEGIICDPIFRQEIYLIVPIWHPLACFDSVSLFSLSGEKFVLIQSQSNLRQVISQAFLQAGFVPNIAFESGDCDSIAASVASNLGIALMPKIAALESYPLAALHLDEPLFRDICCLWSSSAPLKHTAAIFRDFVVSNGRKITGPCSSAESSAPEPPSPE